MHSNIQNIPLHVLVKGEGFSNQLILLFQIIDAFIATLLLDRPDVFLIHSTLFELIKHRDQTFQPQVTIILVIIEDFQK